MNETLLIGAAAILALFVMPRSGNASIGSPNQRTTPALRFDSSPAWRTAPDQLPNETARLSRLAQPAVNASSCACITAPCNCGPVETTLRSADSMPIYSASDPAYQAWVPSPRVDPEPYGLATAPWSPAFVYSETVEGGNW